MSNESVLSTAEYVGKCGNIVSNGINTITINIGNELGLFQALANFDSKPATSQQIADATNCKERYVREWLNACCAASLCEIDDEGKHYWLTKEACAAVTSRSFEEATGFGPLMEMFCARTSQVMACFRKDGPAGLSYDLFDGMDQKAEKLREYMVLEKIETHVVPLLPSDVKQKLETGGMNILDVACGSGGTTFRWAKMFPRCEFTGFDFGEESIKAAQSKLATEQQQFANIKFVVSDAAKMDQSWTSHFEMVMVTDALHDMARPDICLQEIKRVLKPGGFLLVLDVDAHTNPAMNKGNPVASNMYVISYCHCTPVSLYFPGGMGLGTCWGKEKAKEMLQEGGFEVLKQGNDGPPAMQYIHAVRK